MTVLVIAEHDNNNLHSTTLNCINAAKKIGGDDLHVLVVGFDCMTVAEEVAKASGVNKVLIVDNQAYKNQLAENISQVVFEQGKNYSHIFSPATTTGKNLMPRVAALLDVGQISDIIAVESENTFKRPIYAGNAIATVQSLDPIKVVTVRSSAFDAVASKESAEIVTLSFDYELSNTRFVSEEITVSDRPELTAADTIVSGGRALGSSENFQLLENLADKLHAALGASRAAVDSGYAPNDMQVGQTGKVVAPSLYIAIGLSGAIQHLAGMKDSKIIVAINNDEEAPIFSVADYGLVADLFDVVPEMIQKL